MDFITKLPRTPSVCDTIWVIVDRLTKSAHFLAIKENDKMERWLAFTLRKLSLGTGCLSLLYLIEILVSLLTFCKPCKSPWVLG